MVWRMRTTLKHILHYSRKNWLSLLLIVVNNLASDTPYGWFGINFLLYHLKELAFTEYGSLLTFWCIHSPVENKKYKFHLINAKTLQQKKDLDIQYPSFVATYMESLVLLDGPNTLSLAVWMKWNLCNYFSFNIRHDLKAWFLSCLHYPFVALLY